MSIYGKHEALNESTISDRTRYFKHSVLECLEGGLKISQLPDVLADALESERYEMAEGIAQAAEAFRRNPQLGLFAPPLAYL